MAKRDAELKIGADASSVERAAAAAKNAWKGVGSEITSQFGAAARSVATSLADVALAQGKINFSSQHEQVRQFENSSARLAISMGRDLEGVRSQLERTGIAIGKRPGEVAAWAQAVGKLTYNTGGAMEAIEGLSGLAARTGRSVDDYQGLAVTLGTVGNVAGDTTKALGLIAAQADKLGTVGGVAAFADQLENLADVSSHFSKGLDASFTAAAGILGKGLSPQVAGRVQQQVLGSLASDPVGWSRYVGHDITDDQGRVRDPAKVLEQIVSRAKKQYGTGAELKRVMQLNFGAEAGAALAKADFTKAAELTGLAPSTALQTAQAQFKATDAGKRETADSQLAASSRDLMSSSSALGKAADSLQRFAASNPITGTFASTAASGLLGSAFSGIAKAATGSATGGGGVLGMLSAGGGAAAGGLAKLASPALVAGAGLAGYALGSYADEKLGLSDRISGVTAQRQSIDAKADAELAARVAKIRTENSAKAMIRAAGLEAAPSEATAKKEPKSQPQDMSVLAKQIASALANVKFNLINATGGPVDVVNQSGQSAASGNQGG